MTNPSSQTHKPMDRVVLARLTGNLGDAKTVAQCCSNVGALQAQLLGDMVSEQMQLELDVEFAGHQSGLRSRLVGALGDNYTLTGVELRNWCPHFVVGVRNDLAIAMIAQLLGDAGGEDGGEMRRLSSIEADIAALLLNKAVAVLRSGITVPGDFEPVLSSAYPSSTYAQHAADIADDFAAAVRLQVTLGKLASELVIIIPQNVLLKTTITRPGKQLGDASTISSDAFSEPVLRSQVDLSARIRLTPLKLGSIARLRPGDTIPFEDVGEVGVDMDANGKMMYRCEFGRSGDSYSVKVKSNASTDGNIIRHILDI